MRIIECEQGTDAWHAARAGKITASRIADITAKTKSGEAASRANYRDELVIERLTGVPYSGGFKSAAMDRGNETEDKAAKFYSYQNNIDLTKVGLVLHPTLDYAACSPDRLVGDDGIVQIKCPHTKTHLDTLLGASIAGGYLKQIHWELTCTGRQWCDFLSFDDRVPEPMRGAIIRIHRDPILIAELEREVKAFNAEVDNRLAEILAKFPTQEAA